MIFRRYVAWLPLAILGLGCGQEAPPPPPITTPAPEFISESGARATTNDVLAEPAQKRVN